MVITLPITLKEENLSEDALQVIKKVRPSWDFSKVKSKIFTDGITNKLVGYFLDGSFEDEVVMLKMYGKNSELMIDRECEIKTMTLLHKEGRGPELYAIYNNGICYEFLQGSTLNMDTCRSPKVYPLVAAEMAALHSKIDIIENGVADDDTESKMWSKLSTCNDLVEDILQNNAKLTQRISKFGACPGFGKRAMDEMKEILEVEGIPIAFCHNDLLLGNIIYNDKKSTVSFIDFEYAMPNYAAFDVANHFNEFAGIDNPDFSKCPDKAFKSKWIEEYIKHFSLKNIQLDQKQFERWVELCMPFSHLFWALWAIVQAQNSTIDFDFAEYFGLRYVEYVKLMEQVRAGNF